MQMKKNLYISDFKSVNRLMILSIAICLLFLFMINLIIIKTAMKYEAQRITNDLVLQSNFQFAIFGDSNAESALKGNYFENYVNISSGGDNFQDIYKKLNFLLDDRKIYLKKIILQLPIHAFSEYRNINAKNIHFENLENPLNNFYINRLKKYWLNILQFKNLAPIGNKNKNGWYNNDTDFSLLGDDKIQSRSAKRAKQHKPVYNFKDTDNYKALTNIINIAKSNDIKVCAITLPKSHYYLKNLLKYHTSNEIILTYYNLSKEFDFTYFNLIKYLGEKNQLNLFYDPDHINVSGAEKLSNDFKKIDC
jgi:hypothetical protein